MATEIYKLVKTEEWHCEELAVTLRPMDQLEFSVFLGMDAKEGIEYSQRVASESWTAVYKGHPVCIVGYSVLSVLGKQAAPFLYGSVFLDHHPYIFAKYSLHVDRLLRNHSMGNYVLEQNTLAKKWLEWLGFEIGEPMLYNDHVIRPFTREIPECAYLWPSQLPQLRLAPLAA